MRSSRARAVSVCLTAVLAVVLGGCVGDGHALGTPGSQSIPVGQSTRTVESGGVSRIFHLYRPQGLADAAPLVLMLHGGFGTGEQAERSYHWDAEADAGHFLVAYPDGINRAWNAGTCCGEPQRIDTDDVGFITTMVGAIEREIPIDRARVYVAGMSNGAMMALRLGCQSDTVRRDRSGRGHTADRLLPSAARIGAANSRHGRRQSSLRRRTRKGGHVQRDCPRRRAFGAVRQRHLAWH